MTSGRRFIPEVDGLRFLAISGVVLFHLSGYTSAQHMSAASMRPADLTVRSFLQLGSFGVQLFFLLSGFVLALPFAKWRLGIAARPSLQRYYLRRLTRLEPPYFIALCAIFLTGAFLHRAGLQAQEWPTLAHWPNLIASFFYQHNLFYGRGSRILTAAWSLEIEVQFYLLAPLLAVVFSIARVWARRSLLLFLLFAIPALRTVLPADALSVPSLLLYLEWFLAGFLLADFYLVDWQESPSHSYYWDFLNLIAWAALLWTFSIQRFSVLEPPLALVAYIGVFRSRIANWLITRHPITTIGGMCYSIYLLHWHVISATVFFVRRWRVGSSFLSRFSIDLLIILPIVLLVATAFFSLIERPCMDPAWVARLAGKFRQPKLSTRDLVA
jgi:peptidoglycan/LPS O-acetylase OafA/YrhL